MSSQEAFGVRFARLWVARYTAGLSSEVGARRRGEIQSDVYEQIHEMGAKGVFGRCIRGMPADVWWRIRALRRQARQREPNMRPSRRRPLWLALVAFHVALTLASAVAVVPNLALGPGDDGGMRLVLTVISGGGAAVMLAGLVVQRSRFVAGSWLFIWGLLPSLVSPTGMIVLGSGAWTANLVLSDEADLAPTAGDRPPPKTRRSTVKERWWFFAAGFIAVGLAFLGIGNLMEDDGGPLYGRIVAAAVAVSAAGLIVAGLATRKRNRKLGSTLIGIGTLPASLLIVFFWFPPVALAGVLAIIVTVKAFNDASEPALDHRPADVPG